MRGMCASSFKWERWGSPHAPYGLYIPYTRPATTFDGARRAEREGGRLEEWYSVMARCKPGPLSSTFLRRPLIHTYGRAAAAFHFPLA